MGNLVDAGAEPVFAFYLGDQAGEKLTMDVPITDYTSAKIPPCLNLRFRSLWERSLTESAA